VHKYTSRQGPKYIHIIYIGQKKRSNSTHCHTLQYTKTHCNTLQHTATHCNTLQHTTLHYTTLTPKIIRPNSRSRRILTSGICLLEICTYVYRNCPFVYSHNYVYVNLKKTIKNVHMRILCLHIKKIDSLFICIYSVP